MEHVELREFHLVVDGRYVRPWRPANTLIEHNGTAEAIGKAVLQAMELQQRDFDERREKLERQLPQTD